MAKITTIILDLGGVILNLDQERTLRAFKPFGLDMQEPDIHRDFFNVFEKGLMNETAFRQHIKEIVTIPISDAQIDNAWNAMLLDVPKERVELIQELRKNYSVMLLSNTNIIHIRYFIRYFEQAYSKGLWKKLFDKIYYSYNMGMRKPDKEIYDAVLNDLNVQGNECIFIDDNTDNLKGAVLSGIHTIHANQPLCDIHIKKIEELNV
jgi:HAD superfamily hydrolase (TIGR01509 family)